MSIATPVVLVIFKRPDLTSRVLDAIAQAKPRTLLVVADGPRAEVSGELESCQAARAVIDRVDWDCEVVKDYSEINLGPDTRVPTGLDWAFRQVDRAIVLEDDCVPHQSFFQYCDELLERYRDDERVMHIAGSTYRRGQVSTPYSYYFSHMNGCWGWATWRRAWRYFDPSVELWRRLCDTPWLPDIVEHEAAVRHWGSMFEAASRLPGDRSGVGWDVRWTFACWAHSGLAINPRVNLVTNIGFGADATHMHWESDPMGHVPAEELTFPLTHPPNVLLSREADREFIREVILPRLGAGSTPSPLRALASRMTPDIVKQIFRRVVSTMNPSVMSAHTR